MHEETTDEQVKTPREIMKDDSPTTVVFPQVDMKIDTDIDPEQVAEIAKKVTLETMGEVFGAPSEETPEEEKQVEEQVDPNRYIPGDFEALRDMLFPRGWDQEFTSRQWGLIKNCRTYAANEPSGLPGHQLMLIVALMADQFDMVLSIASKLSEDLSGTFTENRIYGERLTKIDRDRRDDLKLIAELETRNQRLRMEVETLHGNHLNDMGRIEELEGQVEVAYEANMGEDL